MAFHPDGTAWPVRGLRDTETFLAQGGKAGQCYSSEGENHHLASWVYVLRVPGKQLEFAWKPQCCLLGSQ